jgi:hypothetical protein
MAAKKSRRSGERATAGRKSAKRGTNTPTLSARLAEAETLATRYLYVRPVSKKETWHDHEPRDLPTMEVMFVRLSDGMVWQVVARHRVKLHDRFNTELYPPPHGRGWTYAGPGYIAALWMRRAAPSLLKRLKVK